MIWSALLGFCKIATADAFKLCLGFKCHDFSPRSPWMFILWNHLECSHYCPFTELCLARRLRKFLEGQITGCRSGCSQQSWLLSWLSAGLLGPLLTPWASEPFGPVFHHSGVQSCSPVQMSSHLARTRNCGGLCQSICQYHSTSWGCFRGSLRVAPTQ